MQDWAQFEKYAFQYYGIDWLILLTVFIGVFLLGNKKKEGFAIGMLSSALALVFSIQVGSIANGITSLILCGLYCRGYVKWKKE